MHTDGTLSYGLACQQILCITIIAIAMSDSVRTVSDNPAVEGNLCAGPAGVQFAACRSVVDRIVMSKHRPEETFAGVKVVHGASLCYRMNAQGQQHVMVGDPLSRQRLHHHVIIALVFARNSFVICHIDRSFLRLQA
jgi:hypothetical protein